MLGSNVSGHSLHVRVIQTLRLRGTPRGGIRGCILKQYTATLSNDGAKLQHFLIPRKDIYVTYDTILSLSLVS